MYMRPMYTFIATIEYHPKVEFVRIHNTFVHVKKTSQEMAVC